MKVIIFGATGMVGQGVLLECLRDPEVDAVLTVGRTATGHPDPKLREVVHADLYDLSAIEAELRGYEACYFCLGVSSRGMKEPEYRRITYDATLEAGRMLARLNPGSTFVYVSGAGTDSTEKGRVMWARVKGETENALLALDLNAYMFRPGWIQPMDGIKSKTALYRGIYAAASPLYPVMRWLAPRHTLTTRSLGKAMLKVTRTGASKRVLSAPDINALIRR